MRREAGTHHTIDDLEERGGYRVKGITPSITLRREAGTHHTIDHLEERGVLKEESLDKKRKDHRQLNELWKRFKRYTLWVVPSS